MYEIEELCPNCQRIVGIKVENLGSGSFYCPYCKTTSTFIAAVLIIWETQDVTFN